jgi:hypothetical protein
MAFIELKLRPDEGVDGVEARIQNQQLATLIASPVTKARPEDRAAIIELCREDWAENSQFSLSLPKLETMISRILDQDEGVIGIIRRSGEIEAVMAMRISQFLFSEDYVLEEVLNFVRPQYRRSTNAKDMIAFAKRCSEEIGIPLVIGVVSNERTAAKVQLYERQLGKACGGYFIWSKTLDAPLGQVASTVRQ